MASDRDTTQQNLIELESLKELIGTLPNGGSITQTLEVFRIIPRASALPPNYDTEICSAIISHFGQHPAEGQSYKAAIKELRGERLSAKRQQKIKAKKGQRPQKGMYYQLFNQVLGPLPRDIFSGDCMVNVDGIWESGWNHLDRVLSAAYDYRSEDIEFEIGAVKPHYAAFEAESPKQLIPTIPAWDGVERIGPLARCCILDGSQPDFTPATVECFFKYWLAGIFRKLKDPRFQNPILILRSAKQGIGKDTLVNTMTDGFEQWSKNMNLTHNDRDNFLQLSHAAVMKIAEFDRTAKTDTATIKDMIFRDTTYLRASHDRKMQDRVCRASFVATVNPEDFYRDSTGNRRYAVFNLERILFDYDRSSEGSKQILAEASELADAKYQIPQMQLDAMDRFLGEKTPQSDAQFVAENWCSIASAYAEQNPMIAARGWVTNQEAISAGLFEKLTKVTGFRLKTAQSLLKSEGLSRLERVTGDVKRGYSYETDRRVTVTDDDSEIPF